MIVIGVDTHKATHTACAVDARTGELRAELIVSADREGHARLLRWARGQGTRACSRSRTAGTSRPTSSACSWPGARK